MKQHIMILTEFAARESSKNIVGWGPIMESLAAAVNALEREIPVRSRKKYTVEGAFCPSCNGKTVINKEIFTFYCMHCGRKVEK